MDEPDFANFEFNMSLEVYLISPPILIRFVLVRCEIYTWKGKWCGDIRLAVCVDMMPKQHVTLAPNSRANSTHGIISYWWLYGIIATIYVIFRLLYIISLSKSHVTFTWHIITDDMTCDSQLWFCGDILTNNVYHVMCITCMYSNGLVNNINVY